MSLRTMAFLWTGMLCSGCLSVPEFDEPSLVDRPRVLAIVAEPPEIAPGEPVHLSVMMAAPEMQDIRDYKVEWRVCGAFFSPIMGSQYGEQPRDQGCAEEALRFGDGPEVNLPGEVSETLFANLELASKIVGAILPEGTIELIKDEVGLPLLVEATVQTPDGVVRAAKRVIVNGGGRGHHNPPPPAFDFGGEAIVSDSREPFLCRADSRLQPTWPADREVELSPEVIGGTEDPDQEFWIERYPILNARGELEERDEKPFYSWFASAGELDQGVTEAPLRNELWRTPKETGPAMLWLVVRDGHGGSSGCGLEVMITP